VSNTPSGTRTAAVDFLLRETPATVVTRDLQANVCVHRANPWQIRWGKFDGAESMGQSR
jgi:predicted O-linked N-acetylglucosamine transferase (SPINDLY family)